MRATSERGVYAESEGVEPKAKSLFSGCSNEGIRLDLYFSLFLDEVELLTRAGLIKKYLVVQENTNSLKGQLLFSQNIKNNLIHKERFFTRHQQYSYDNVFNQIIYKALIVLASVSNDTLISDRINRIKYDLPDITELNITAKHFDRLQVGRKTAPYEKAIQIAKMIILNYSPDIKAGRENMIALLFDMNKLWEEYIYRMLKRASADRFMVSYQNSQKFWENKTIRPDIIVHDNLSGDRFVLDAKWKIIDSSSPADDDLKQMFVYNIYYNTCKSLLVYPKVSECREKFGKFHKGRDGDNLCKVSFVAVINNNGLLDPNIGRQILDKLEI